MTTGRINQVTDPTPSKRHGRTTVAQAPPRTGYPSVKRSHGGGCCGTDRRSTRPPRSQRPTNVFTFHTTQRNPTPTGTGNTPDGPLPTVGSFVHRGAATQREPRGPAWPPPAAEPRGKPLTHFCQPGITDTSLPQGTRNRRTNRCRRRHRRPGMWVNKSLPTRPTLQQRLLDCSTDASKPRQMQEGHFATASIPLLQINHE